MPILPYLFFNGRCEEAIDFYRRALGADVEFMMRYRECPDSPPEGMVPPDWQDKVLHAEMRIGDARLLVSDGCSETVPEFQGFSLSLTATDAQGADRMFSALLDGGEVLMPMDKTFFSPRFGMVSDRFGVSWMIYLPPETTDPA